MHYYTVLHVAKSVIGLVILLQMAINTCSTTVIMLLYQQLNFPYLSFLLILVNSTSPASMGRVSCPAEIISLQSSNVWSVTGTFRALKQH